MAITDAKVRAVRREMTRLEERILEWESATVTPFDREHGTVAGTASSGAVRRASMDLTRALAELRRA